MKTILLPLGAGLVAGFPSLLQNAPSTEGIEARDESLPNISLSNIKKIDMKSGKGRRFSGPFMNTDFPDPSIISVDAVWYAFATSSNGHNIPWAQSQDTYLSTGTDNFNWALGGSDALPDIGSWANSGGGAWAPDIQKNDAGTFVMYYTAQRTGGTHCIGAATASVVTGPYTPQSSPLVCDDAGGGLIDPSGYDDGTNRWLLYKVDGNSLGGATTCQGGTPSGSTYEPTPIMIQQMARDALTLQGGSTTILDNQGAANDGVTEAPSLYQIGDGSYVLFYSAHCYSSDDYDIEAAFSSTINGAYGNRIVVLRSADNRGVYGPGGLDIDPNGHSVVFHGRTQANDPNGIRELYSADITIQPGSSSI
ncbi:glycoside hydrolase family 43 protein [Xylariaceae sp. FL0255]|nr:glycoside hydrolase family 43 protein [Xylariaceae sp. FL0255]